MKLNYMFNKFFEGILHRFMYGHNIFVMVGENEDLSEKKFQKLFNLI